jgi:tRNA dimethylallyltransferase
VIVPALVGATAVGKSALSLEVAEQIGAEIISMDSRQVYRGLDIGTAKVGPEARARIRHHGLDLIDPTQRYSAVHFARDTRSWVTEIEGRGSVPLLVGGTGFFLRALMDPVFREPTVDHVRRDRLRDWLAQRRVAELAAWVRVLDPARASLAEAGGAQRLSRSVEVPLLTGRALSWWHREGPAEAEPLSVGVILMERSRDQLYHRINERSGEIFSRGIMKEVEGLLRSGYSIDAPGMTAVGYREAAAVVSGEIVMSEAIDRVQSATRGYARRQLTWFRNQIPEPALRIDASKPLAQQALEVVQWWEGIGEEREGVSGA